MPAMSRTADAGSGTGATGGGTTSSTGGIAGPGGAGAPAAIPDAPPNPGWVTARRLNRTEYNNTVRDLLGTKLTPANDFPADDLGGEFDTVGSALSLSPSYVMAYEKAAHALAQDLMSSTDAARKQKILTCNVDTGGDACAKTVLTAFARRAWRRPATPEEIESLMGPIAAAKTAQPGGPILICDIGETRSFLLCTSTMAHRRARVMALYRRRRF